MYCILAVVYFLLVVLLITLSETYQLWVLLVPLSEACLSATLMQYTHVECKVEEIFVGIAKMDSFYRVIVPLV